MPKDRDESVVSKNCSFTRSASSASSYFELCTLQRSILTQIENLVTILKQTEFD